MCQYFIILYGQIIFHCIDNAFCLSVNQLVDISVVLLWSYEHLYKFLHGHTFPVLLGVYPEAELLGDMVTLFLTF